MKEATKKVIWLKCHPYFSYYVGDIADIRESHFEKLIPDEYVRPITEAEILHIEELKKPKPPVPLKDYIKVTWLKYHSDFSYSAGNIGTVSPENFLMLSQGGFVEAYEDCDISLVWKKIKSRIKK